MRLFRCRSALVTMLTAVSLAACTASTNPSPSSITAPASITGPDATSPMLSTSPPTSAAPTTTTTASPVSSETSPWTALTTVPTAGLSATVFPRPDGCPVTSQQVSAVLGVPLNPPDGEPDLTFVPLGFGISGIYAPSFDCQFTTDAATNLTVTVGQSVIDQKWEIIEDALNRTFVNLCSGRCSGGTYPETLADDRPALTLQVVGDQADTLGHWEQLNLWTRSDNGIALQVTVHPLKRTPGAPYLTIAQLQPLVFAIANDALARIG